MKNFVQDAVRDRPELLEPGEVACQGFRSDVLEVRVKPVDPLGDAAPSQRVYPFQLAG